MKINGYEVHPLCLMVPEMSDAEKAGLLEDIKQNKGKLREKVVIHEGKILDGRHRAQALGALGIPLSDGNSRDFYPEREGTPEAYVISKNVYRRHLSEAQKAALIFSIYPGLKPAERGRPKVEGTRSTDVTVKDKSTGKNKSALLAELSDRTVRRVVAVQKKDPESIAKIASGETTLKQVEEQLKPAPQPQRTRTMICLEDLIKELGTDDRGIFEKGPYTVAFGTSPEARKDIESLGWGLYEL